MCPANNNSSDTDGPDFVYEVVVDPNKVVLAEATDTSFDDLTAYILNTCQDTNSCLAGANDNTGTGDELVSWQNDTGMTQTVYVVIDGEDGFSVDPVGVDIQVRDVICTPNTITCGMGNGSSISCDSTGTRTTTVTCPLADCEPATGLCATNGNSCSKALPLTPGVTINGELNNLTDDYSDDCGITTAATGGPDAVYVVQNVQVGDIIDVEAFFEYDGLVYITQNCDMMTDSLGSCIQGRR